MLKTLNKRSKRLLILKIRLKDFIKQQLWVYLVVFASIALCSWVFNKWIEGIAFCIAHTAIRTAFDKQFHFNTTAYCLSLTLAIIWFAIPITLPLATSLLSSIPIAFLICFFGYLAQDRLDKARKIRQLERHTRELIDKIMHKQIFAMSEEELYAHCRSRGLDDADCKIAYFLIIERLKGKELYEAIGYSERQTKRKRKKILETIE